MRVVLDTNVLIDGVSDEFSPSAKLVDAILRGDITAVVSHSTLREYRKIIRRLISDEGYLHKLEQFFAGAEHVEAERVDVVIDDEEDKKFVATAAAGGADMIVTSDRHLLDIGEYERTRIVRPAEAWQAWHDQRGGEWGEWARGLGIG